MDDQNIDELAMALNELAASAAHHERIDGAAPRKCPVCGETMTLFKQFDIVIDVCEAHGVWLDQGELATLLERTYWHRREIEDRPDRDLTYNMDQTRKTFTAGMRRVMGVVSNYGR